MLKNAFWLSVISLAVLFTSCSKETVQPEPKPVAPPDTVLTGAVLIGKWEAVEVRIENVIGTSTIKTEWIKDKGKFLNDVGPQGRSWWPEDVSMIEFANDHTFKHYKPDGEPDSYMLEGIFTPNGKWQITDDIRLNLTSPYNGQDQQLDWFYLYEKKVISLAFRDSTSTMISDTYVTLVKKSN